MLLLHWTSYLLIFRFGLAVHSASVKNIPLERLPSTLVVMKWVDTVNASLLQPFIH